MRCGYYGHEHESWTTFSTPQVAAEQLHLDENLKSVPENGTVVDLGAGAAFSLEAMIYVMRPDLRVIALDPGFSLVGNLYDVDEAAEQIAGYFDAPDEDTLRSTSSWHNRLVAGYAEAVPVRDNSADMVVSYSGVPEYSLDRQSTLDEALRVLKKGSIFLVGPMHESVFKRWNDLISDAVKESRATTYQPYSLEVQTGWNNFIEAMFTKVSKQ